MRYPQIFFTILLRLTTTWHEAMPTDDAFIGNFSFELRRVFASFLGLLTTKALVFVWRISYRDSHTKLFRVHTPLLPDFRLATVAIARVSFKLRNLMTSGLTMAFFFGNISESREQWWHWYIDTVVHNVLSLSYIWQHLSIYLNVLDRIATGRSLGLKSLKWQH